MSNNSFKAGILRQGDGYKYFLPNLINKDFMWQDRRIDLLLEKATRYLGELNAYSKLVPDVDFFIKAHIFAEADASSRLEGTKTNLEDAFKSAEDINIEKRDDWVEVQNYVKATNFATEKIKTPNEPPLSMRLMNDTHKILLSGARGQSKMPGEIRKSQNWIGATLASASYIPPHWDYVPELLGDLEKFWHNKNLQIPELIKLALSHYQFETIHPYCDGNGRIGRLIITLQLINKGFLNKPTLYVSKFFEKHKPKYNEALQTVRETNNIDQWVVFFLTAIAETTQRGKETFEKIIDLRKEYEDIIESGMGVKRQKLAKKLLLELFSDPVMTIDEMTKAISMSFQTASTIAKELQELNILKEITGASRNRIFALDRYLKLFVNN